MQIIGILLMIAGAGMAFFVRRIIEHTKWQSGSEEDEDFVGSLSAPTMAFKLVGFGIVVVGAIVFFLNA